MSDEPTVGQLFDLSGRVALITGATGWLGGSMALALAEAGASVIAASRDRERAAAFARELPVAGGARHCGVRLDYYDPSSIEQGLGEALELAGHVDILVNNGYELVAADWTTVTAEQFNRQLGNLSGCFLLARGVRDDAVRRRAPASIIMLGSMYGLVGSYPDAYEGICNASPVAYHAMKGGILQMTRHLAVYWARDGVRVNALTPGPFPNINNVDLRMVERLSAKCPMKRMGRPDELKGAVVFLAGDASSYMTGQNLIIDGGWTAW